MREFTNADVGENIDALITFIGAERVKKAIATWRNAIANSPPLVRAHEEQAAFHWWPGFTQFWESKASGTPYTLQTLLLAKDATKILDVLDTMPEAIRAKYAPALGDVRNAPPHMFELSMAHHFLSFGHQIRWVEATGKGIPEFVVVTQKLEFEVECKYLSVDAGRLVSRQEFSRLGAIIEAQLRKRHLLGDVHLVLRGRMPKATIELDQLVSSITDAIDAGNMTGELEFAPWGRTVFVLSPVNDEVIDWEAAQVRLRSMNSVQGHALATAESLNGRPINLIFFTLKSEDQDEYLKAIYTTMKDAAKRQLSKARPGLLCVHIPEIRNFASLIDESALRNMTAYFFNEERHRHVCAISYSSDTRIVLEQTGYQFTTDALAYKNANGLYQAAKDIQLFHNETKPPKLQASDIEKLKSLSSYEK